MTPRARLLLAAAMILAGGAAAAAIVHLRSSAREEGGEGAPAGAARVERSGPLSKRVRLDHPEPGQRVVSPLVVVGRAPGGWYFEADFPLGVLDGAGRSVADSFAAARGEWMTSGPVAFHGVVRLPPGLEGPAVLVLRRANASGLPEHDAAVSVPLRVGGASAAAVHFPNSVVDPGALRCDRVYPVARELGGADGGTSPDRAIGARARELLGLLLAGPRRSERLAGYHSALPDGVGLRSVAFRAGTLSVDFDRGLSRAAGSCRVLAIRAQIESTLYGLPGVGRVRISVEGREAEALQP